MIEDVRPAIDDDLAFLVASAQAFAAELHPMRGGALWHVRQGAAAPLDAFFEGMLASDDATVVVGTIDGAAVGYGVLVVEALRDGTSLAVITDLYVEPEARAVGIGDRLVGALVADARRRGCVGIDATALPGHRSTKNFFEGQGFVARSLTMHRPLRDEP